MIVSSLAFAFAGRPETMPLDLQELVDTALAQDPQVILLGEEHEDTKQTAFGVELALALAERGWLDVLMLEYPRSQTRGFERAIAGEGPVPRQITNERDEGMEKLVAWNRSHPDKSFRIVANDLEHGFTAREELTRELEAAGRELPSDDAGWAAIENDASLDPWVREVADNMRATLAAYAVSDAEFWPTRQVQVISTLDSLYEEGVEGKHVLLWGGSLHTGTREPCDETRWEGCHLAHERSSTKGRTFSISMSTGFMGPGQANPVALEACRGTPFENYGGLDSRIYVAEQGAKRGADVRIWTGEKLHRPLLKRLPPDAERMFADTEGASLHDWVVLFATSTYTTPPCAGGR